MTGVKELLLSILTVNLNQNKISHQYIPMHSKIIIINQNIFFLILFQSLKIRVSLNLKLFNLIAKLPNRDFIRFEWKSPKKFT